MDDFDMDARAIRLTWSVSLGNARVRFNKGQEEGKGDGESGRKSWSWPRPCHLSRVLITLSIESSCPVEEGGSRAGRRRHAFFLGLGFNFHAAHLHVFIDLHASILLPTRLFSYAHGFSSYARGFSIYAIGFCFYANLASFYSAPSPAYAPWARWDGGGWVPLSWGFGHVQPGLTCFLCWPS